MDERELRQALRKMLQSELEAMQYYQQASRYMQDEAASYHFNLLAQEELEHARTFYEVYPGDDLPEFADLIKQLPKQSAALNSIDQQLMARLSEQHALQLAIKMEAAVADNLKRMLARIHSPAARITIEKNIESTLNHLELIEQDYQRLFETEPEK